VGTPWRVYDTHQDGGRHGVWVSKWLLASAIGKLVCAASAYALGRAVLKTWVLEKSKENRALKLIHGSVAIHPFRTTCLLMRYSCFPDFVKNCCASVFDPTRTWMFILSIMMHGWLCIWGIRDTQESQLNVVDQPKDINEPEN
jgi:uncharacterized membrane protein YdjX (TVP38/TMEM64 family)